MKVSFAVIAIIIAVLAVSGWANGDDATAEPRIVHGVNLTPTKKEMHFTDTWTENARLIDNLETLPVYSAEELARYDGSTEGLPLLLSIKGFVFDVSSGSGFYAPGKSYNYLTGVDGSWIMCMMPSDWTADDVHDDVSQIPEAKRKFLDELVTDVYMPKYPLVGRYVGGYFFPAKTETNIVVWGAACAVVSVTVGLAVAACVGGQSSAGKHE